MDYVNVLPIVNNSPLMEGIKLKLLRLLLGENGQSPFNARRLNEASLLDDALRQLKSILSDDVC